MSASPRPFPSTSKLTPIDGLPIQEEPETTEDVPTSSAKSSASWLLLSFDSTPSVWDAFWLSTAFKLLLFPAYRSTDFEVHRNWLAITHSLPLSRWYYDTTSEWTLDYPPFFAYFEKLLSIPASFVDPGIVDLHNLNYGAWTVVAFQRLTVIATELVLGAALLRFNTGVGNTTTQRILSASLFLHPGFLIVDHIHFQYNGFMFGILLWSLLMAREGNLLASGFFFAVLLNFKHIYMYIAPAYFIYLLRAYCLSPTYELRPTNFLALANTVISVFAVSLVPFALQGQLPQLLSRLFPFTRGLNHAYWAPNAWALVTALDRVLLKVGNRLGMHLAVNEAGVASTSRGLVGDTVFAVIPNVKPIHTFAITLLFQAVFLIKLWRTPTYKSFVAAITLCGYSSFMFGWHVHEKAILLVLVPLSLIAAENYALLRTFMLASSAGIFSLFPLLFTPAETPIKVIYTVLWTVLVFHALSKRVYEFPTSKPGVAIAAAEKAYLFGFYPLQLLLWVLPLLTRRSTNIAAELAAGAKGACGDADHPCTVPDAGSRGTEVNAMEFLPLMITSVYCALGLTWAFLRLSWIYLRQTS